MTEILCAIISALSAVIVAIVSARAVKSTKSMEELNTRQENRAKLREEESRLSLQMMDATLQLSIVSANALTDGHNNGNVERAREAARVAAEEYKEWLQKVAAHEISK